MVTLRAAALLLSASGAASAAAAASAMDSLLPIYHPPLNDACGLFFHNRVATTPAGVNSTVSTSAMALWMGTAAVKSDDTAVRLILRGDGDYMVSVNGCTAALQAICGANRSDVFACAMCAGTNQQKLHGAGCDNKAISAWCTAPGCDENYNQTECASVASCSWCEPDSMPPNPFNGRCYDPSTQFCTTRHGCTRPTICDKATQRTCDPYYDCEMNGQSKCISLNEGGCKSRRR